jgi:hypothetical protein
MPFLVVNVQTLFTFVENKKVMIKITYAQSDFKTLITKGFFYQDRTQFIQILEDWKSNFFQIIQRLCA